MEILLGGLAGLGTGVVGSILAAVVQSLGRWLHKRRLARGGKPPVREQAFTPYWVLFGMLGFIAGTWMTGAMAGLGVPAIATLIFLGWALAQLVRRAPKAS
ncbi:MAG: hypothetical protein ACKVX7_18090 [Planctomycetota bacterium]